jgi:hypothetical protein
MQLTFWSHVNFLIHTIKMLGHMLFWSPILRKLTCNYNFSSVSQENKHFWTKIIIVYIEYEN